MTADHISCLYANMYSRLICDARLSWRRVKGYVIFFVFATEDELARWPAKKYPKGDEFEQKIAQMQSRTIGVKFTC
jgi:hypothetical protein